MKIITWNVRCQNGGDDARGCGWAARLPLTVENLRELSPDIFAVQEAHLAGEKNRIDYVFADRHWNIESHRVPDDAKNWPPASDHRPVIVELQIK